MKKLSIEISTEAYSDLNNIWYYTLDTWSEVQADKYFNEIVNAFDKIALKPSIGKSVEHLRKGYWNYKINLHLIFYIYNDKKIEIIRILHAQMDIPNRIL